MTDLPLHRFAPSLRSHRARLTAVTSLLAAPLAIFTFGCSIDDGGGRDPDHSGIEIDTGAADEHLPGERGDDGAEGEEDPTADIPLPDGLEGEFAAAAEEFDVPAEILRAVSFVETGWQMVQGSVEFEGRDAAFGVMGLRGELLDRGALLAGVTNDQARTDRRDNVRAAAAAMSDLADELGVNDRTDAAAWGPVLERYSGIENPAALDAYVWDEVFPSMRKTAALGTDPSDALDFEGVGPEPTPTATKGPDYGDSIWRASPNNSSRGSYDADMVIIHTCEGSYSGCWGWLSNTSSGVSAHYVVNNTGTEISQLVRESRKAWHIGAKYDCNRNSGVDCNRNGVGSNSFTVGIEHAGYASQKSWDPNLIDASAQLVCDITQDQGIPRDRYHIVGHGQLQPYNRVDPGANWPWTDYLKLIDSYCGGTPTPPPSPTPPPNPTPPAAVDIVVDSNPTLNGPDGAVAVSSAWVASSGPTDYNTGYWWRSTQAASDVASFAFYLDNDASLEVEAWWTSGTNRSSSAPFLIYDSSNTRLDTVYANQQKDGGQWNGLGTYNFTKGWNYIDLSVWAPSGYVVIADAVRVHTP